MGNEIRPQQVCKFCKSSRILRKQNCSETASVTCSYRLRLNILYVSVGKGLKKRMKQPEQLYFLDYFEKSLVIDDDIIQKVSKFIQTVCYNRFKELELEFIKRIRIRIYKKMKIKLTKCCHQIQN